MSSSVTHRVLVVRFAGTTVFNKHREVVEGRGLPGKEKQLSVVQLELEVVCLYPLRDGLDYLNIDHHFSCYITT